MAKKTTKLYNDTLTILFDDQTINRYVVEETGQSPVGVTTILQQLAKPALMLWPMYEYDKVVRPSVGKVLDSNLLDLALKAYTIKSDKGKDTGTEIHSMIEKFLREEMKI